jgi:hypothetical protein
MKMKAQKGKAAGKQLKWLWHQWPRENLYGAGGYKSK